jgi:hypothetical protein
MVVDWMSGILDVNVQESAISISWKPADADFNS